MKNYIIEETEKIIGKYEFTESEDGTKQQNEITITNKRFYIHSVKNNQEVTNIANIDSIQYVKVENVKVKRPINFLVYIGLITIMLCGILGATIKLEILGGMVIGLVLLIFGAELSASKSVFQMVIGVPNPFIIYCKNLKEDVISEIQKNIFLAQKN